MLNEDNARRKPVMNFVASDMMVIYPVAAC